MDLLKSLNWRYATKKFDAGKKVSQGKIETLKDVIKLSPSSYGLQLYKVLIIEDLGLRKKLLPFTWGQNNILNASHLFVFCNYAHIDTTHVDSYIELSATACNLCSESLIDYSSFLKEKIREKSSNEQNNWTTRQAYIALANLLTACAALRIDACPMEGFDSVGYDKILGLTDQNLNAAVLAAVGYRSPEDQSQYLPKIRKPKDLLFEML